MKQVSLTFYPEGIRITVPAGTDLLTAALKAGLALSSSCGGKGVCGRCRVKIKTGDVESEPTGKISAEDRRTGIYLACRTLVRGDTEVEILPQTRVSFRPGVEIFRREEVTPEAKGCLFWLFPRHALTRKFVVPMGKLVAQRPGSDFGRIEYFLKEQGSGEISVNLATLRRLPMVLQQNRELVTVTVGERPGLREVILVEPGDTSFSHYGVAVDVGTTTISACLVNLNSGQVLGTEMAFNRQVSYGEDVITRMMMAEKEAGLEQLHHAVVETINELIRSLTLAARVNLTDITAVACSGNMTMMHLLLKINPSFLRREPYEPSTNNFPVIEAAEVGIRVNPSALLAAVGGVSSYVGGDITAGVLTLGLLNSSSLCMLLDIGTNGEMVLGNKDWLVCCSASAGPAFEGSGVQDGMRAIPGAIEEVRILSGPAGELVEVETIAGHPPIGICGSGYMSLLAALFEKGIIDRSGHFTEVSQRMVGRREERGYQVVAAEASGHGRPIVITQIDIENLLRAKAAIYAGMTSLVRHAGISFQDIDRIYIAGGFGSRINIRSAIKIGLLPDLPEERFQFVGNTSLQGAYWFLMSKSAREASREIINRMTPVELSLDPEYMEEYLRALFIPHTDLNLFPSVRK